MNRPTKIGKYEVIDVIGRGGMGVVYKATDPQLDRLVAIKMMTGGYAEEPDLLKRFYREAQSTASLQHGNIVTVYDLGDQAGSPYLVMEYLEGESLDTIISSRRVLTTLERIHLILEACHGLSYAHGRGIVHRDIKPGNIMVSKNGAVKLVDFGIAHIASKTLTRTGQIMGSVNYMSPEQINGQSVDPRTDIFSIGVVLYQVLTFALPFEGESTAATLLKIIHDPPPPLHKFLSVYPEELESIVLRALAKNREDRYPSVDEFALDLLQVHERLKQEMVTKHLAEAEALLGKGDLNRARDQLLQLLKLDQKHTQAIKLLRVVQQRIEKEQGGEQARQLRAKAETSYLHGEFEAALRYLDEALSFDSSNRELASFRETVREAKFKAEQLQQALSRAELAHARGDLDTARQAADEALELNPNHTQAKALYRIIHRDWVERSRQRQLDALLESARKEILVRNLTGALNILKQAEALDPQGTQVRALVDEVTASREQDRRRKELERINREIEEALDRDDCDSALRSVEEGLRLSPQDRGLVQLKALAERQRAATEQKLFVRQQLAAARELLERGQAEDARALLQSAIQKVPQEPQLEALLTTVKERVARDKQEERRLGLQEINWEIEDALNREDYSAASTKVEQGLQQFSQDERLLQLRALVQKLSQAEQHKLFVREQVGAARSLLDAGRNGEALALLRTAIQKAPQEPQLETLLTMVQEQVLRDEREHRREGLDRIKREVDEALQREDYAAASARVEDGLRQFPQEPGLAQLKPAVARQRAAAEQKLLVREQIATARQLLDAGRAREALTILQNAVQRSPQEAQLEALLTMVRDRVAREEAEQAKSAHILRAREALDRNSYREAVQILEAAQVKFVHSPEIDDLLRRAREQDQKESEQKVVEDVIRRAQQWISEYEYERAIRILETTLQQKPDDHLQLILNEARGRFSDYRRDLEAAMAKAQQFIRDGAAVKAVEFLAAQPQACFKSPEFNALLERSRTLQVVEAVERQVDREPDLDVQVKILENAQKKYPAHANWQQRLLTIRERRKQAISIVQRARKFERAEKYREALEEWQRMAGVHAQYPQLAEEIERLNQLVENARLRAAVASVQQVTVEPKEAPVVSNETSLDPTRIFDRPADLDHGATTSAPDKLEARVRDLYVAWTANRKNLSVVGVAAAVIIVSLLAAKWWMKTGNNETQSRGSEVATLSPPPKVDSGTTQSSAGSAPPNLTSNEASSGTQPKPSTETEKDKPKKGPSVNGLQSAAGRDVISPPNKSYPAGKSTSAIQAVQEKSPASASSSPATSTLTQNNQPSQLPAAGSQQNPVVQPSPVVASNQPPAQPPQPTNNPTTKPPDLSRPTPNISPEKDAINRALGLYKDAYQSESLEELLKIWPSLSKDQRKELKKGFEKAQAVRVDLENCTDPDVAGDRAQVTCAQSMRYTVNGKVQPYQKMSVNIVFRKTAGGWLVDAVQAN